MTNHGSGLHPRYYASHFICLEIWSSPIRPPLLPRLLPASECCWCLLCWPLFCLSMKLQPYRLQQSYTWSLCRHQFWPKRLEFEEGNEVIYA